MNSKKKKGYYQRIVNDIIKEHGKDNFTYRLMGEALEVSKQRAKQIVDYYGLSIPTYNYFGSKECADLKRLIETNEVSQYTFKDLYEKRYKRFLPRAFIMELVGNAEKNLLRLTNKAHYKEFFSKTKTEDKTKRELFAEVQAMFPHRKFNYSSFCSDLDERNIPFKRQRSVFVGNKNLNFRMKREAATKLIQEFLTATAVDPTLYAMDQFYVLYEQHTNGKKRKFIEYITFRETATFMKVPFSRTKPIALRNRLLNLGIDLKAHDSKEIVDCHNARYPLFPITSKMLNAYGLQSYLGRI